MQADAEGPILIGCAAPHFRRSWAPPFYAFVAQSNLLSPRQGIPLGPYLGAHSIRQERAGRHFDSSVTADREPATEAPDLGSEGGGGHQSSSTSARRLSFLVGAQAGEGGLCFAISTAFVTACSKERKLPKARTS